MAGLNVARRTLAAVENFNSALADRITAALSSMWCAYLFAALALISLPTAIGSGTAALVAWTAQTFIQLVALAILGAGQDKAARWAAAELRETHDAVMEVLADVSEQVAALHSKQPEGS